MHTIRLLTCIAYWVLLTVLLLIRDPTAAVGLRGGSILPWGDVGIHFTAFTILAMLVHASRWPKGIAWPVLGVLLAYSVATESLQWFIASRSVEPLDYMENIFGIAAGTAAYWLARRQIKARRMAKAPATGS